MIDVQPVWDATRRLTGRIADQIVYAAVGGSTSVIDKHRPDSDWDVIAVRVEPFIELVAAGPSGRYVSDDGHRYGLSMMFRSVDGGEAARIATSVRTPPGGLDVTVHTLRKYMQLAASGNPTILANLYARRYRLTDRINIDRLGVLVASRQAAARYRGYMYQQLERWTGERGQRNVTRPELVEAHGYDTKYAAQIYLLGAQGICFLRTGVVDSPLDGYQRDMYQRMRDGRFDERTALEMCEFSVQTLEAVAAESPLPESPDLGAIARWLADTYRMVHDAE